ncbi:GGDEF domain-containing protein [Ferrimonas futtsuensis]|uniref:GGDEF domain-containing protein n=1 Tax=Ferrimonas futtsuensis TaxID=364764 RepID=UPI0003F70FD6|nr:diguanylate cyclase [Ferrimonas futtsuensis]
MSQSHYPEVIQLMQQKHLRQGTLWVAFTTLLVQLLFFVNLWEHLPQPLLQTRLLAVAQAVVSLLVLAVTAYLVNYTGEVKRPIRAGMASLVGLAWCLVSINSMESWGEYHSSKQIFMLGCLTVVIGWYTSRLMMCLSCCIILVAYAYLTLLHTGFESVTYYLAVLKFPLLICLSSLYLRRWYFFGLDRHSQSLELLERFRRETTLDPLTQVMNRRGFDEALSDAVASARRLGIPATLMLVDIDHFKQYNDALGHDQGDKGLKLVANTLSALMARQTEVFCRVGGEEFAVILAGTDTQGAKVMAQRMQQAMEALNLPHPDSITSERVTLSIGIAQWREQDTTASLYRKADQALYHAKSQGRDCWAVDRLSLSL